MGRIFYIMGKSATGKDTVFKELLKRRPELTTVVPYTTRPIREGETDGVEYFFTSSEKLEQFKNSGKIVELRTYETVMGPWSYFTMDDGQFDIHGEGDCLMIGTLESYEKMCRYYGNGALVPVYIEVPDGIRLLRENRKIPITGRSAAGIWPTRMIFLKSSFPGSGSENGFPTQTWRPVWKKF